MADSVSSNDPNLTHSNSSEEGARNYLSPPSPRWANMRLPERPENGTYFAHDWTIRFTARDLKRGVKAISRLYRCDPYAAGSDFTLADLYTFYSFSLASAIVQKIFDEDLLADLPEVKALMDRLRNEDSIREVEAAKQ